MSKLLEELGFGLVTSSVLVFGAGGFSIQYGLTNTFNFAYGSILTSSAFVAYAVNHAGGGVVATFFAAVIWGALFSTAINAWIYRPFARRGAGLFGLAIVSVALGTVIQYTIGLIFGEGFVSNNVSQGRTYHFASMVYTGIELEFMAFAVIFFVGLHICLRYTRLGRAIRATAADPKLARVCGIRVTRVVDIAWIISGSMCGIGGFYLTNELGSFSYTSGQDLLPAILAAAIVGGAGSAYAAFGGALLIGIVTELLAAYTNPALKEVYAFTFLFILLIARPQGLLRGNVEQQVAT